MISSARARNAIIVSVNQLRIRSKKHTLKILVVCSLIVSASLLIGYLVFYNKKTETNKPASSTTQKPNQPTAKSFDKSTYSVDEPGSLWWIVNKKRPLPDGYIPSDLVTPNVTINVKKSQTENQLRSDAASALEILFAAAKSAGHNLMLASGYRSTQLQAVYYNGLVASSGQAAADRLSAKPGTSEHQTGLSLDVARADRRLYLEQTFGKDPAGIWLAEHVHEYGFIIRYPEDKESSTGYDYEPWHIRFVGKELAAELHSKEQTMEEFFEL